MTIEIDTGRFKVGGSNPAYFIADIAANHNGDLGKAKELIYLCAEAGANAAKFQNFRAETIVSDYGFRALGSQKSHQASWRKSVVDVYRDASLPMEWTETLRATCDQAGIDYFTSPYDPELIPQLSKYVCAWKLGSGDITWHQEIELLARDRKPLFIATGASTMDDVRGAMAVASRHSDKIVLMQCNTNYTASVENFRHIALNVLKAYAREFPGSVLGLSDHTPGHATVLGAVALGARAIEKHFTDDTNQEGPDHRFSMDPASWRDMVDRTRELEAALGGEQKRVMDNERETYVLQRRAVRAVRNIAKGQVIDRASLTVLRPCPADALVPYELDRAVGVRAKRDIAAGDHIRRADVE
jgi:N-acetylneuraminate synthase